ELKHIKKDAIKLVEQNGIEDALELLNRCIEMGTTYGSAYNNMVKLYRMLHENIEAIHDVNKVVSLEEEQSKAYIQRAILKCQDGDILGSKVNFAIDYYRSKVWKRIAQSITIQDNPYVKMCNQVTLQAMSQKFNISLVENKKHL
ncbi:hypothetical protein J3Q64DRAFT_1631935, partial [Phycomyces blakesleeanus]